MKSVCIFSLLIFSFYIPFCQQKEKSIRSINNQSARPANILEDTIVKVTISNGDNGLEISPFSNEMNGAMIEPINKNSNTGLNTSFFLRDTSSWKFFTNSMQRLAISGDGKIITGSPLLINNASDDGKSSLRVNGNARFDSAFFLQAPSDSNSFISIERNIKSARSDYDDKVSPYAESPVSWAAGMNIPVFRLRHPLNVSGVSNINTSLQRDFKIYPYQYGTAIEYNGVVECWVGEWSIHRGLHYTNTEGNGNVGWGAVLWVGDDNDLGGIRATARNNIQDGGNTNYGELSVEKFAGGANGDFRLRLPSTNNNFQFVYGGRGSENIIAKISSNGLVLPIVPSVTALPTAETAQLLFDSTDKEFKGYNGTNWVSFGPTLITGSSTQPGDGVKLIFTIPHGLTVQPSYFNVIATGPDAANISYITADTSNIIIHYVEPPPLGFNNLSWNWQVKK